MEVNKLKRGDVFEIVRNSRQYEFIRFSNDIKPRDIVAKCDKTGKETWINMQTKIKAIKLVSDEGKK